MLDFLDRGLTKEQRKKVEKYMSQYENLDMIIKSKRVELQPKLTSQIKEDAVQESNGFSSSTEDAFMRIEEIEEIIIAKKQLDIAYKKVKPMQKTIWRERYIEGRNDYVIYQDLYISHRTYYREKKELINVVATCLNI